LAKMGTKGRKTSPMTVPKINPINSSNKRIAQFVVFPE
jgi:hypothetical protein